MQIPSGVLVGGTGVSVGSSVPVAVGMLVDSALGVVVGEAEDVSLGGIGVELTSCALCPSPSRGVGVRTIEGIGTGDMVSVLVGLPPPPNILNVPPSSTITVSTSTPSDSTSALRVPITAASISFGENSEPGCGAFAV